MKRTLFLSAILTAGLAATGFVAGLNQNPAYASTEVSTTTMPRCYEDEVLVGEGSFTDGQYARYVCGPAFDDFNGGSSTGLSIIDCGLGQPAPYRINEADVFGVACEGEHEGRALLLERGQSGVTWTARYYESN